MNNDSRTPYLSRVGFQGFPELKQGEPELILWMLFCVRKGLYRRNC
jgi:hypothetical protein